MMNVKLQFDAGPMRGDRHDLTLGTAVFGREPQPESGDIAFKLSGATQAISRSHFKITYRLATVVLINLSANGTRVDGKVVHEEQELKPGAVIEPEQGTRFSVTWTPITRAGVEDNSAKTTEGESSSVLSSGPLASPLIRAVLAVYLLGIVATMVWFSLSGAKDSFDSQEWHQLQVAYGQWASEHYTEQQAASRLILVEERMSRLEVLLSRNERGAARVICRELRALDGDINSPLYRYAVNCLSRL